MSLKNPVTSPGIDPETIRLIAQHLNHSRSLLNIVLLNIMEIWHPKYKDQAFSDENFVSLSENFVSLSENFVSLSENFVSLSESKHKNEENTY